MRNLSSLHGLRSSRAGYELTIAVQQAVQIGTQLRWVNGLAMLAVGMTKTNCKKGLLSIFVNKQRWRVVHDDSFTAGRKVHKAALQKQLMEKQASFVSLLKDFTLKSKLPWFVEETAVETDDESALVKNLRGFISRVKSPVVV